MKSIILPKGAVLNLQGCKLLIIISSLHNHEDNTHPYAIHSNREVYQGPYIPPYNGQCIQSNVQYSYM